MNQQVFIRALIVLGGIIFSICVFVCIRGHSREDWLSDAVYVIKRKDKYRFESPGLFFVLPFVDKITNRVKPGHYNLVLQNELFIFNDGQEYPIIVQFSCFIKDSLLFASSVAQTKDTCRNIIRGLVQNLVAEISYEQMQMKTFPILFEDEFLKLIKEDEWGIEYPHIELELNSQTELKCSVCG